MNEQIPDPNSKSGALAWLRRRWALVAGAVTILAWFSLNINQALSNARLLPNELSRTADQFFGWYYDDAEWNGYWTSNPESYSDIEDMNLSKKPFALSISVKNGAIDGMISNEFICSNHPYDFALVEGSVDEIGKSAVIVVFDNIRGRRMSFGKLKITLDQGLMTVEPMEGFIERFPSVRIAPDSGVKEWPSEFCEGKQAAMRASVDRLLKKQNAKKQ